MSNINWGEKFGHWAVVAGALFLAALLVIMAVAISDISNDVYQERATSQAYSEANQKFRDECTKLTASKEILSCFDNAIENARETERNEEDIRAQKEMANAAWAMFFATMAIGLPSLLLSLFSIKLIRETLHETARTADAAVAANLTTREIGEAQVGAYLTCKSAKYRIYHDRFEFAPIIENKGQSPALDVVFFCKAQSRSRAYVFIGPPKPGEPIFANSMQSEGFCQVIPSGAKEDGFLVWLWTELGEDGHNIIYNHNAHINIDCRLVWSDVFGNKKSMIVFFHRETSETSQEAKSGLNRRKVISGTMVAYNKNANAYLAN